ncbi:MAG: Ig-like domain-containing protein, partial [Pirellulaceae bacterium]
CDIDGDVEEGDGITVWAELEGDWDDTSDPDVEFKAFIGGQLLETEVVNIAYFGAYYAEMSFSVPDDGPDLGSGVWGNDTDTDDVTVDIIYEGLTDTLTIPVENLSPVFDQHAIVESEVNTAGDLSVSVSAISFYDPGVRDQHKVTVTWADDTTTEVPYDAAIPISKTFAPTPANPEPAVYPIDILITDDDTETGGFRLDALELDFNGDDDDGNGILDRDDVMASLGDDDLVSIDLAPFLANIPPGEEGDVRVYYSFDSMSQSYGEHGITRLWLDSSKSQTLTEATDDYGWVIPAGVTQLWVEGTNFGSDTLDFNWVPKPDDCKANYHAPVDLGVIFVTVPEPLGCYVNHNQVNVAPVAADDYYTTVHGGTIRGDILSNDFDPNLDSIQPIIETQPQHGFIEGQVITALGCGSGEFTYVPDPLFAGVDQFTYRVWDGLESSSVVTVELNVTNSAPVINDDSGYNSQEEELVQGDVSSNDYDADGDPLRYALESGPNNGSLHFLTDGSFSYVPNVNFTGVDSFTYTATDGIISGTGVATIQSHDDRVIDIDGSNDGSWLSEIEESTYGLVAGTSFPASLLIRDLDIDSPLTNRYLAWDPSVLRVGTNSSGFLALPEFPSELQIDNVFSLTDQYGTSDIEYHATTEDGQQFLVMMQVRPFNVVPISVEYTTDHAVLLDETQDPRKLGKRFNDVEIEFKKERLLQAQDGQNFPAYIGLPFTHSFDSNLTAKVTFKVNNAPANGVFRVETIQGSSLNFKSGIEQLKNGQNSVTITSSNKFPNQISALRLAEIWGISVGTNQNNLVPKSVFGTINEALLTADKPEVYEGSDFAKPTYVRVKHAVTVVQLISANANGNTPSFKRIVYDLANMPAGELDQPKVDGDKNTAKLWEVLATGSDCISVSHWTAMIANITGMSRKIDVAVEIIYLQSPEDWDKGAIYNDVVKDNFNENGRNWELQLWLVAGKEPNRFEGTVVVNNKNGQDVDKLYITPFFKRVYKGDPAGMDAKTAVLHGIFDFPAWIFVGGNKVVQLRDPVTNDGFKYTKHEDLPAANKVDPSTL